MPDTNAHGDAVAQAQPGPGAASGTPPQPAASAEARTDERRFRVYTFAVLSLGLVAAFAVGSWQPFHWDSELLWIGPVLAVAFLLAEQLGINVDVRSGISWTISFTEIPLVIGFFVAPFEVVLAAHLVAGIGTLLARKVSGRVLYNAGAFLLEITGAFAVAGLVKYAVGAGTGDKFPWVAALAGTLTAPLVSTLLALAAVRVLRRRMRVSTAVRLTARILVVGFVNASVGLSGYLVISNTPKAWPLVLAVFLGLTALYWAYSDLLREQRDMEALSDVSLMVARSGQLAAARPAGRADELVGGVDVREWATIAERIKDQLAAGRVVLRLRLEAKDPLRVVVAGDDLPPADPAADDPLLRLPGAHVRHFRITEANPDVRAALLDRGAQEALVVPLRSANQLLGVVEAHDRLSRWRGFGKYDVQLLGTMASHLATSLDNRRLLATLRHDAYHDPLTGHLNRLGFRQVAKEPLRDFGNAVVLRIDLDVFSTVSDALGYAWADRMVIAAARRIRDALGPDVPLARLEGASFAALLAGCPPEDAHDAAERLREGLSAPYPVDRLSVEANAMIGYATTTPEESGDVVDIEGLLQRADVAVRATKGGRRGPRLRAEHGPDLPAPLPDGHAVPAVPRGRPGQRPLPAEDHAAEPAGRRRRGAGPLGAPGVRQARPGRVRPGHRGGRADRRPDVVRARRGAQALPQVARRRPADLGGGQPLGAQPGRRGLPGEGRPRAGAPRHPARAADVRADRVRRDVRPAEGAADPA